MNIVIPMGGKGLRFKDSGISIPKPLIEVDGVPMIRKVIENITFEISYYSGSEVLKVDTVHYKTSDQPYAKPGESTHFAQQIPATTDNARVRVLNYND